jgi:cell wall-active antibiotic response 4TMS protein YvqF
MVSDTVQRHRRVTAAIFGVILIGLGTIFTLDNLGYVDAFRIWEYWPVVLIGFGLASLIAPKDAGDPAGGAVMTAVGTFFLLRKLDVIDWRLRDVWPMFLVFAGVALIARALTERRVPQPDDAHSLSNGGAR